MSQVGVTSTGEISPRSVQPQECATVDDTNVPPSQWEEGPSSPEDPDTQEPPGGGSGGSGFPCTPIVVNLGNGGFSFTSPEDGVMFDMCGNGVKNHFAWTEPGSEIAFLFLDRNGNGIVDNGTELFGDRTPQPPSEDPNGYLALAVFDDRALGGNGDGRIGPEDAVFDHLYFWIDANHDGESQTHELIRIRDAGVEYMDLDYVVSNRRDRHGNLLRYKSLIKFTDRMRESVDVIFLQGDD